MKVAVRDVVHVGLPKSASTWLQTVVFPAVDRTAFVPAGSDIGSDVESLMFEFEYVAGHLRENAKGMRERLGRGLILSREGLSFRGKVIPGRPRVGVERTANRMVHELGDAAILFISRRQDSLLMSVYSQYVHRGGTRTLTEWMEEPQETYQFDASQYCFDRTIEIFKARFTTVTVVPFELLALSRDEFLERVGWALGRPVPVEHLGTTKRSNQSLSAAGIVAFRWWNEHCRRTLENRSPNIALPGASTHRRVFQSVIDPAVKRFQPKRVELDGKRALDFASKFAESNRMLQQHVDIDLASLGYVL